MKCVSIIKNDGDNSSIAVDNVMNVMGRDDDGLIIIFIISVSVIVTAIRHLNSKISFFVQIRLDL